MELKEIGAYDDEATGLRGVRRLALTHADAETRRRCVQWMVEAGLKVRVDRIGNVYATRPGRTLNDAGIETPTRRRARPTRNCEVSGHRGHPDPPMQVRVPVILGVVMSQDLGNNGPTES
jgi:hypothetical protein